MSASASTHNHIGQAKHDIYLSRTETMQLLLAVLEGTIILNIICGS